MPNGSSSIVQKLWNYCNVLRDDGMSYGDYVEQLTYLLFLKMADERSKPLYNQKSPIPTEYNWQSLLKKDGEDLFNHYRHVLERLGKEKGLLGLIFNKAQNKFQDPAKLRRLIVDLINKENWSSMSADVKGDAYEGLLEKNAQDTKSGAGQYFTPRPLIQTIVDVMAPKPNETICDPACGTGGFLIAAHDFIADHYRLTKDQKRFLDEKALWGWELVQNTARLCAMNFMLHGIGGDTLPIIVIDSLAGHPGDYFDIVLTNPPFGKKSSITIVNGEGKADRETLIYERQDFWATTSNKQLNFLQHVKTLLKQHGRAAIVVPDNVLFEGGAGETVRRKLLHECDVHTLLRLPTGLFYAQGVKANVLFFDKKPASEKPWTKKLWIYDFRTNKDFTLKTNPLKRSDLDEFVKCYNPENRHNRKPTWSEKKPEGRWRAFDYEELVNRDKASLDIFWLKDESIEDSDNLPDPDILAREIVEDLQAALVQFQAIAEDLGETA
ncbi:MAG: type I restriction-modification system subunit M [Thermodesulfovibrionales bacterium]|nr:type I restriction-modification system subunit M [Thermodesulfovibrionales bacterium]